MLNSIENRNVERISRSPAPCELRRTLPVSPAALERVVQARDAIRAILHGHDRARLVVVVGPCSIHDESAALEYADLLARIAERTANELVIVMRCYFEKPRTSVGWKGLLYDPDLDGSCDLGTGLRRARGLLANLAERGIACGGEALDPISPQYLADLWSWVAIGARTCESQIHRELASGLSMPVGIKNPTSGDLGAVRNAIESGRSGHTFPGVDAEGRVAYVRTRGNPDLHFVLRGGANGPNFERASVCEAAERAAALGLARGVLVDCSHGNSRKDHTRQGAVCQSVLEQVRAGQAALMGVMVESHLRSGRQDWTPGARMDRGRSITDACIGWPETERLLEEMACTVSARRSSG